MTVSFLPAALLVVMYLASALASGAFWEIDAGDLLELGGSFAPALAAGEGWRLVTAAFLHGSVLHLLVNAVILSDAIGLLVATAYRDHSAFARVSVIAAVFLLTAAAGFAASAWWNRDAVSIGASGGILGLYGFWLASAWFRSPHREASAARRRALRVVAGYLLAAVLAGFLVPGIDNAAHLGGLLSGVLLGSGTGRWPAWISGCIVGLATTVAVLAIPDGWAESYRQHREFEAAYRAFAASDRLANEAIGRLLDQLRDDASDPVAQVATLDREVIGRLRQNLDRWSALEGLASAGVLTDEWARWRRYGEQRLRAALALREALLATDAATQARALREFDVAMTDAKELAEVGEVPRRPGSD